MAARPHPALTISRDVAAAIDESRPVVALESTLITHGLPYPTNVETAVAMEDAIRVDGRYTEQRAAIEEPLQDFEAVRVANFVWITDHYISE